jgi:GNAT superfamily N-acetyltransferase
MSDEINIRIAQPDDAAGVANLVVQLGYDITIDAARRRLVQIMDRVDHAAFVATNDNRIVGFIHAAVTESLEHEPRGEIRTLSVDEDHRSTGIGERLLEVIEGWAKQRRLQKIRVRSNVKRERARRFYERHGYEVVKSQNVFDKTLR